MPKYVNKSNYSICSLKTSLKVRNLFIWGWDTRCGLNPWISLLMPCLKTRKKSTQNASFYFDSFAQSSHDHTISCVGIPRFGEGSSCSKDYAEALFRYCEIEVHTEPQPLRPESIGKGLEGLVGGFSFKPQRGQKFTYKIKKVHIEPKICAYGIDALWWHDMIAVIFLTVQHIVSLDWNHKKKKRGDRITFLIYLSYTY